MNAVIHSEYTVRASRKSTYDHPIELFIEHTVTFERQVVYYYWLRQMPKSTDE